MSDDILTRLARIKKAAAAQAVIDYVRSQTHSTPSRATGDETPAGASDKTTTAKEVA